MVHNFWVSITRLEEAFKVSRISTFLSVRLKVDLKRMPCSSIPPSPLPGLTSFVIFAQLHYLLQRPDPAAFAFLFIPFHALEVSYGQWWYSWGTAEALEDRRQRCAELRHAVPSAAGQMAEICKFKPGTVTPAGTGKMSLPPADWRWINWHVHRCAPFPLDSWA